MCICMFSNIPINSDDAQCFIFIALTFFCSTLDRRRISEYDVQASMKPGERRESMFVTSLRDAKKDEAKQSLMEAESAEVGLVRIL